MVRLVIRVVHELEQVLSLPALALFFLLFLLQGSAYAESELRRLWLLDLDLRESLEHRMVLRGYFSKLRFCDFDLVKSLHHGLVGRWNSFLPSRATAKGIIQ